MGTEPHRARLLPAAHAQIVHLWTPPFASDQLRRRLWKGTRQVDAYVAAVEREGRRESDRIAAMGVALAHAAGWTAEPLTVRCYGGDGFELTEVARKVDADVLLVGSRGLGGARAVLGSVSDMAVHYATQPILVAPYPLLASDENALAQGPILVAWDGSAGAATALRTTVRLWPQRRILLTSVDHDIDPPALPGKPQMKVLRVDSRHEGSPAAIADALAAAAREQSVTALPVVDTDGFLVGMVSEGDLLWHRVPAEPMDAASAVGGINPGHRPGTVEEVMSAYR
jgi:nucleotide-binding universal stress UspA family protein